MAYQFDKLEEVVLEDANDMLDAYYNQCPNLKTLFINANISENMVDIKKLPVPAGDDRQRQSVYAGHRTGTFTPKTEKRCTM